MSFNPMFIETNNGRRNNAYSIEGNPRYLKYVVPTQVTYQEPTIQFKVFAFDKVNGNGRLNFGEALSVYRFELLQNQSFSGFLNVLKSHGISTQSHKFYYIDDEQDLVVLTTEYDFKYMLKIMKGKTIKIALEKISQPTVNQRSHPRFAGAAGFRNLPFVMRPLIEKKDETEELTEHVLDSVLSDLFQAPQVYKPQCNRRVRTIRLSDLLKNSQQEEEKQEKKEEKQTSSFEEYLFELFGKKLSEGKKEEETKLEKAEQKTVDEKKEETVEEIQPELKEEKKEQVVEKTPSLTTSQIISNYLIDENEEEDIVTDEEEEDGDSDDQISVSSEPVDQTEVQYPSVTAEEEPINTIPETSNEEQPSYENELKLLSDMGFSDSSKNLRFLNKYSGDVQRVVSELIYYY